MYKEEHNQDRQTLKIKLNQYTVFNNYVPQYEISAVSTANDIRMNTDCAVSLVVLCQTNCF